MSDVPATPQHNTRHAANARFDRELVENACLRCLNYLDQGTPCEAVTSGLGKKKCKRCVRGHHVCEPTPTFLIPAANRIIRARKALEALQRDAGGEPDAAVDAAKAALTKDQKDFIGGDLKAYHTNKNKVIGDQPLGRGRAGSVTGATGMGVAGENAVLELQRIRRGIFAIAEVGREVSSSCEEPALPILTNLELLRLQPGASLARIDRALGEDLLFDEEDDGGEDGGAGGGGLDDFGLGPA